jgi:hypothetical protein
MRLLYACSFASGPRDTCYSPKLRRRETAEIMGEERGAGMSFFYHYPAPEYRQYMNKEGEVIPAYQKWNESNGTYSFSHGLGIVIVLMAVLIAAYPILPQVSAVGSSFLS